MAETITTEDYEDLKKKSNQPMVLEFGADW